MTWKANKARCKPNPLGLERRGKLVSQALSLSQGRITGRTNWWSGIRNGRVSPVEVGGGDHTDTI